MPETIVRFDDRRPIPAAVFVGNENDNLVESVEFELAEWLSEAVVYIYLTANGKSDVVNLGADRVFDITRTHTHEAGRWEAYLEAYLNGDRVWHSDEFAMYVGALPAIGKQIEQQYPTAIEDALAAAETLTGMGAKIEMLPEGSEPTVRTEEIDGQLVLVFGIPAGSGGTGSGENGATFLPHVSNDGVISWTNDRGLANPAPVSIKGIPGEKGADGFSPTISTEAVAGGYRLTIENPNDSYSSVIIRNGTAPSVQVNEITGGNRVTITGGNGAQTFDVLNGKDGKDGNDVTGGGVEAALGYTPADAATVVQHTAQALTESQKTQVRENIGAEKASAKYELIEAITCDGTYGMVTRDGLSLARVKIYCHTTAASATASYAAEISNGAALFGYAWIPSGINTANRWVYIYAESDGVDAYLEFTTPTSQSYGTGNIVRTANRFSGDTPINKINLYVASGGLFPEGSTIEIWGVRA